MYYARARPEKKRAVAETAGPCRPGRGEGNSALARKWLLDSDGGKNHLGGVHEKGFFKLDELARASGTSARTIRYYVQRGLLPSPQFRGKDTAYDGGHLVRLRAIRRLQEAFFPLDAIAVELERQSLAELERLADGRGDVGAPPRTPSVPAPPEPSTPSAETRTLRAIDLAAGVSLLVDDAAPAESRRLVEEILATLHRIQEGRRP